MYSIFTTLTFVSLLFYTPISLGSFLKAKWLDGPDGAGVCWDYLSKNLLIIMYANIVFIVCGTYFGTMINNFSFDVPWYSPFGLSLIVSSSVGAVSLLIATSYSVYNIFVFKKTMYRKIRERLEEEMEEDYVTDK